MKITEQDVAWCAGVVDALALIRTRETDAGSILASVSISTAHIEILETLAALTGTSVVTVTRDYKRVGCSAHCTEPHQHVLSVTGRWSLTGARAVVFLKALRPLLRFRAEAADAVLLACADAPAKPATANKMKELGWPT